MRKRPRNIGPAGRCRGSEVRGQGNVLRRTAGPDRTDPGLHRLPSRPIPVRRRRRTRNRHPPRHTERETLQRQQLSAHLWTAAVLLPRHHGLRAAAAQRRGNRQAGLHGIEVGRGSTSVNAPSRPCQPAAMPRAGMHRLDGTARTGAERAMPAFRSWVRQSRSAKGGHPVGRTSPSAQRLGDDPPNGSTTLFGMAQYQAWPCRLAGEHRQYQKTITVGYAVHHQQPALAVDQQVIQRAGTELFQHRSAKSHQRTRHRGELSRLDTLTQHMAKRVAIAPTPALRKEHPRCALAAPGALSGNDRARAVSVPCRHSFGYALR